MTNLPKGFTLVELLVYIASMTVVLAAVMYMIVNAYGLYSTMLLSSRTDRTAGTLAQILATELRSGSSINQSDSVFNTPQGRLAITSDVEGVETESVFSLDTGRVVLSRGGEETPMTPNDITVSKLLFTQIITPVSYAVRYEIDLSFQLEGETVTNTYPGLVILRRSYE